MLTGGLFYGWLFLLENNVSFVSGGDCSHVKCWLILLVRFCGGFVSGFVCCEVTCVSGGGWVVSLLGNVHMCVYVLCLCMDELFLHM